jgi:hypothetical protein
MKNYNDKPNNELVEILNNLSEQHYKLKMDVEDMLRIIDDIEKEYLYIHDIINKRMGK